MIKAKRRIAWMLSFLMVFSLIMGTSKMQVDAYGGTYIVEFGTGSWTVGGVTVTADKTGQQTISETEVITLTNFNAETMEVKVSESEGFNTTLMVDGDGKTSLSAHNADGLPNAALTFSVEEKSSGGGSGGGAATYTVEFGTGSWAVGDVTVTADKTGQQTISETEVITLTNFNAETMEVKVSESGGFNTTLTVDANGKTSLAAKNCEGLPNATLTFSVEEKSSGGGSAGGGNSNPTITISVNIASGSQYLDTYGNYLKVDGVAVENGSVTVEQNATHVIALLPNYGTTINTQINGVPATRTESDGWLYYTVNEESSYSISISEGERNIFTVIWFYDEATVEDAKVLNGTVNIISAKLPDGSDGFVGVNTHDKEGGHYSIVPGSIVTVEIKPDYGYQFVAGSLNGQTVTAGTEVSTFTFIMPSQNLHLSALFTKTEDIINADSKQVTSGSLANGEKVVDSGNLKLEIGDLSENEITAIQDKMEETAGDDEIQLYLDMDLYSVVNKGNENDVWENKLTNLNGDLSITLELSDELKGKEGTFYVIREHEEADGSKTYTKIEASYDKATGTITFVTNKFSTYALVYDDNGNGNGNLPNTGDTSNAYVWFMLALVSGIGALIYGKKSFAVKN